MKSVEALLDPASGGHDGTGWRLGEVPSDTDIAGGLSIEFSLLTSEEVA